MNNVVKNLCVAEEKVVYTYLVDMCRSQNIKFMYVCTCMYVSNKVLTGDNISIHFDMYERKTDITEQII